MAQRMPLPLTVSCFSKIQIGFTFLVPVHPGSPGKGPLNGCVCVHTVIESSNSRLAATNGYSPTEDMITVLKLSDKFTSENKFSSEIKIMLNAKISGNQW